MMMPRVEHRPLSSVQISSGQTSVEISEGLGCPSPSLMDKNEEKVQVHEDMWHVIV
jgi:hypothetical protein